MRLEKLNKMPNKTFASLQILRARRWRCSLARSFTEWVFYIRKFGTLPHVVMVSNRWQTKVMHEPSGETPVSSISLCVLTNQATM
jgi:hypothetical protein